MKLAIMQPYIFPWIGYFRLIAAADRFVVFDDVNFIKRGWINRNRILLRNEPYLFSIPLQKASQNRLICQTAISTIPWQDKLLTTLQQAYQKAPFFQDSMPLLRSVLEQPATTIDELAVNSLQAVVEYLTIDTSIVRSTRNYGNQHLKGQDRIIDICRREGAKIYINATGGRELYDTRAFAGAGIALRFLNSPPYRYLQWGGDFVAHLSIIDLLMFMEPPKIKALVEQFELDD